MESITVTMWFVALVYAVAVLGLGVWASNSLCASR